MSSVPTTARSGSPDIKSKPQRIPLDYYKKPTPIERWKVYLSALALILTCGFLVWATVPALSGSSGHIAAMRGPVTKFHAAFEATCERCHVPFSPMTQNSRETARLISGGFGLLGDSSVTGHAAADAR